MAAGKVVFRNARHKELTIKQNKGSLSPDDRNELNSLDLELQEKGPEEDAPEGGTAKEKASAAKASAPKHDKEKAPPVHRELKPTTTTKK